MGTVFRKDSNQRLVRGVSVSPAPAFPAFLGVVVRKFGVSGYSSCQSKTADLNCVIKRVRVI